MLESYNFMLHSATPSAVTYITTTSVNNTFIINNNLRVDADEVILLNGVWNRAFDAKVGDTLFNPMTGKNVTITNITAKNTGGTVYDFYLAPNNNFIGNGYLIDTKSTTASCVSATSQVLLANGTYVPAYNLRLGDAVYSYNINESKFVTSTVVAIYPLITTDQYIINGNLYVDGGQPLIVNGTNMINATDLKIGDTMTNPLMNQSVKVTSIKVLHGLFLVYEFNAVPVDNYVVNGYVVP